MIKGATGFSGIFSSRNQVHDTNANGAKKSKADNKRPERFSTQESQPSRETCLISDGRRLIEKELDGILFKGGKHFSASLEQGKPAVLFELKEQRGKWVFVEQGEVENCLVNRGKQDRARWEKVLLAGEHVKGRLGDGPFRTSEGFFHKSGNVYVPGAKGGMREAMDVDRDEIDVDATIRQTTADVEAWVNECPLYSFERTDREVAAKERLDCLHHGKKAFQLNRCMSLKKLPPNYFVGLERVEKLDLRDNPHLNTLEGSGYERLVNLKHLFLDDSPLWDITVGQFRKLKILRAQFAEIAAKYTHSDDYGTLKGLDQLSSLQVLIADVTAGVFLDDILGLSSLRALVFDKREVDDDDMHVEDFHELKNLNNLEILKIDNESLDGIENLPQLKSLQTFVGSDLGNIGNCIQLEEVHLIGNGALNLEELGKLPHLQRVTLSLSYHASKEKEDSEESFLLRNNAILRQLKEKGVKVWESCDLHAFDKLEPLSLEEELQLYKKHVERQLKNLEAKQLEHYEVTHLSMVKLVEQETRAQQQTLQQLGDHVMQTNEQLTGRMSTLETSTAPLVNRSSQAEAVQNTIWNQMTDILRDPAKRAYFADIQTALYSMMTRAFGFQPQQEGMGSVGPKSGGGLSLSGLSSATAVASTMVESASVAASLVLATDPLTKILQAVLDAYAERNFNKKAVQLTKLLHGKTEKLDQFCHTVARALTLMKAPDLPQGCLPLAAQDTSVWKKLKKKFVHQSKKLDGTASANEKRTHDQVRACVHAAQFLLGVASGESFGLESHEVGLQYSLREAVEKGLEWFCKEQERGEFQFAKDHIEWGVPEDAFKPGHTASPSAPVERTPTAEVESRMIQLVKDMADKLEQQGAINKKNAQQIEHLNKEQDKLRETVLELKETLIESQEQNQLLKAEVQFLRSKMEEDTGNQLVLRGQVDFQNAKANRLESDVNELKRKLEKDGREEDDTKRQKKTI